MRVILTKDAPVPRGHYSHVIGQLGVDPANPQAPAGSIEAQTERALRNVEAVLVSDLSLWGPVNLVYARLLGEHRPARAVVPVKEFRDGMLIEIQGIAAVE
jgi:2-iminobutanoate/2-iminopropanoate deaminase